MTQTTKGNTMTEEQIKHMRDRFLYWKLPENFSPDCGITFNRTFNHRTKSDDYDIREPVGTNLFDAAQAEQMIRFMIEGMP